MFYMSFQRKEFKQKEKSSKSPYYKKPVFKVYVAWIYKISNRQKLLHRIIVLYNKKVFYGGIYAKRNSRSRIS